ncbi:MAG TPA: OsmC family peroxiredoxin [Planctomycetota bacterium]|nr:OsmC family peroxiredoxin [Planctomycetota bacterium]
MILSTASVVWHRGLKDGKGTIGVPSGVLSETPYSFASCFEDGQGTNPEELLAAALAACFTMTLSARLVTLKFTPERVRTTATVTLEFLNGAWTISKIALDVAAKVPRISESALQAAAGDAKYCCPISRMLNVHAVLNVRLESQRGKLAE